MNPASSYYLSFNLGYPNAFDQSKGYTGDFLMVHGRCVSIGCYAMTDPAMDEIWALMTAAFQHGQREIDVHIFPYQMNWPMSASVPNHPDSEFWKSLAPAWKRFAQDRIRQKSVLRAGNILLNLPNNNAKSSRQSGRIAIQTENRNHCGKSLCMRSLLSV